MRALMGKVRTRAGLAAIGGALLLTGVGFGATAASGGFNAREVADTSTVAPTTSPAATTEAAPAVDAPAPTVEAVTEAPAPQPDPEPQPDPSIGTTDANGHYTPAIPVGPGDPPVGPNPAPPTVPDNNERISVPTDGPAKLGG